jgi:hypothetical protein
MQTDGRTDMTALIFAVRNFAKAPKTLSQHDPTFKPHDNIQRKFPSVKNWPACTFFVQINHLPRMYTCKITTQVAAESCSIDTRRDGTSLCFSTTQRIPTAILYAPAWAQRQQLQSPAPSRNYMLLRRHLFSSFCKKNKREHADNLRYAPIHPYETNLRLTEWIFIKSDTG